MSETSSSLSEVQGVVPVSSVAGTTPVSPVVAPVTVKETKMSLLTNRAFQVFVFAVISIIGLVVLMSNGTIPTSQGLPMFTAISGFMLGVPVSTSGTNP